MINKEEVKKIFLEKYVSEDGGCRLDSQDDRDPFPPSIKRTVKNQNPVMFLAETLLSFQEKGLDVLFFENRAKEFIEGIECDIPGCFNRRPNDKSLMDSHDNMLGIVALCALYGFKDILSRILSHGESSGWVYDNLSSKDEDTSTLIDNYFKALRQGKDIAVYKLAAGRRAYITEWMWLLGSACVPSSDIRLLRMRMRIAELAARGAASDSFHNRIYTTLRLIYLMRGGDIKYRAAVEDYFKDPHHPMRQLWTA